VREIFGELFEPSRKRVEGVPSQRKKKDYGKTLMKENTKKGRGKIYMRGYLSQFEKKVFV